MTLYAAVCCAKIWLVATPSWCLLQRHRRDYKSVTRYLLYSRWQLTFAIGLAVAISVNFWYPSYLTRLIVSIAYKAIDVVKYFRYKGLLEAGSKSSFHRKMLHLSSLQIIFFASTFLLLPQLNCSFKAISRNHFSRRNSPRERTSYRHRSGNLERAASQFWLTPT